MPSFFVYDQELWMDRFQMVHRLIKRGEVVLIFPMFPPKGIISCIIEKHSANEGWVFA